eukprot:scaffold6659_cov401-Prasinococcus_capsulatus_cf.AAC.3
MVACRRQAFERSSGYTWARAQQRGHPPQQRCGQPRSAVHGWSRCGLGDRVPAVRAAKGAARTLVLARRTAGNQQH